MNVDKPSLKGSLRVPGDKSISHRALIFSLLTTGTSQITGLSPADDCLNTINCLQQWGLTIETTSALSTKSSSNSSLAESTVLVTSSGLTGLTAPQSPLYAGNSGTTLRLLTGVAAGQEFLSCFEGDESLQKRPMSRVIDPLVAMGADVLWHKTPGYAPFAISGGKLKGIQYQIPTASAQVQTALLLAGLQSSGTTTISIPDPVRDHTLRLFRYIGVPHKASIDGTTITVERLKTSLPPYKFHVPSDISSCAFFMVAAALLPGSKIRLEEVGINPGRRLVLDVLHAMGAQIEMSNAQVMAGEPTADIVVQWSERLSGVTIDGSTIATGIDEIPILALAGTLCQGKFLVQGASELKVKESNRLSAIVSNLREAGARIKQHDDGFEIEGQEVLAGGSLWKSYGDHRLAMTGMIANLLAAQPITIDDAECISISYPSFQKDLTLLLTNML